jgi:Glutathione peroxidase
MVSIKLSLVFAVLMMATSVVAFMGKSASIVKRAARSLSMGSFYDITEKDAAGNSVSFSKFKGKVVYGVNVATKCGYTASGYALLSKISKMNGIEVAIFPCNQVKYISLLVTNDSSIRRLTFTHVIHLQFGGQEVRQFAKPFTECSYYFEQYLHSPLFAAFTYQRNRQISYSTRADRFP